MFTPENICNSITPATSLQATGNNSLEIMIGAEWDQYNNHQKIISGKNIKTIIKLKSKEYNITTRNTAIIM